MILCCCNPAVHSDQATSPPRSFSSVGLNWSLGPDISNQIKTHIYVMLIGNWKQKRLSLFFVCTLNRINGKFGRLWKKICVCLNYPFSYKIIVVRNKNKRGTYVDQHLNLKATTTFLHFHVLFFIGKINWLVRNFYFLMRLPTPMKKKKNQLCYWHRFLQRHL